VTDQPRALEQCRRWRTALIVAVIVAAVLLVFGQVYGFEFVTWDDPENVSENPHLRLPLSDALARVWTRSHFATYLPVTYTAWALLAKLSPLVAPGARLSPAVFHLGNLGLHLVNVLLVFGMLRLLVRSRVAAGAGALLFALHPLQAEPVAWVSGMKDLMAGALGLGALWLYLLHARSARDDEPLGRRRTLYWSATALFVLAVLAKSSAAALPLMAWVLDRLMIGRDLRSCTRALAPWLIPAVLAAELLRIIDPQTMEVAGTPLWLRPLVAGDALAFYLGKLFVPRDLGIDYGRRLEVLRSSWWFYVIWVIPVAAGWLLWWLRDRRPWATAAGAVMLAGLLPTLGLISIPFQAYSTVADRYMYLAMLGPGLALAGVLSTWRSRRLLAVAALVLALLGVQATMQTMHWRSSMTLFAHTMEVNPESWLAYSGAGTVLFNQGRQAEGLALVEHALRINPGAIAPRLNVAELLFMEGRPEDAIYHLRELVRYNGQFPGPHDFLACALEGVGEVEEARAEWARAIEVDPRYTPSYYHLAVSLLNTGQIDQAVALLREALRIKPDYAEARKLLDEVLAERAGPTPAPAD